LASLAGLVAAVLLAQSGHYTLVSHVVCAHGELVHGDDGHDHAPAAVEKRGEPGPVEAGAPAAEDDHHHCVAVVPPALSCELPVAVAHELRLERVLSPPARSASRASRRWLLAPKTSPPSFG
jgi:hypothetical protein